MSEPNPHNTDIILGEQNPPPVNVAILGGLAEVKQYIVALLTSLENLVKFWECRPIGKPWETVPYDPQIHQSDVGDIQVGESVYVRFIVYQKGDRILIPAKVSRTLPAGAKA